MTHQHAIAVILCVTDKELTFRTQRKPAVASVCFFIKLKIFTQSIAANKVKNHLKSVKYDVEHKIITTHK